ncbi:outer membrane beta-barrel protein [Limnohabitans sp.]|uniref:outer membrane beta-barrel protein n=1 Tax=Limnohabitans sp. TaxID=1907725 RepID=UPI003862190A
MAQVYLELGSSFVAYKNSFGPAYVKTNQQIGRVIVGFESSKTWSGELMTGIAQLSNNPVYLNNVAMSGLDIKFNKAYAVYLKGNQFISNDLKFFGRVGFANVAGSGTYQAVTEKFQESGISYGLGAGVNFKGDQYLNIDYLSIINKNEMHIKAVSISYGKYF